MNAVVRPVAAVPATAMPPRRLIGAYMAEARSECARYMRSPAFMLPVLIFSCVLYLMFGVVMAPSEGQGASTYLLATYSVFGIMSPGLFGFGVSLASERDNGLLTLKRALPMPPGAYLIGKMIMAMAASGVVVCLLLAIAAGLGHVRVTVGMALGLLVTDVLGVLPFCALGMWVGSLIKGQGAPGMLNLIYLPMSFLSGLWFPLPMLPHFMQTLAPIFPSYHLGVIALDVVGVQQVTVWPHALVLAGFGVVFLGLAIRRLRRHG